MTYAPGSRAIAPNGNVWVRGPVTIPMGSVCLWSLCDEFLTEDDRIQGRRYLMTDNEIEKCGFIVKPPAPPEPPQGDQPVRADAVALERLREAVADYYDAYASSDSVPRLAAAAKTLLDSAALEEGWRPLPAPPEASNG